MSAISASEVYARGLVNPELPMRARFGDGSTRTLALERWLGPATTEECAALDRVCGPVLDVGCGAGRHVVELQRRGVTALGLDIVDCAVEIARRRGAAVLHRSVFEPLPLEGWWASALLLDGNVGIGGDPLALLRRMTQLLRPGGRVLVEVEPVQTLGGPYRARVENGLGSSGWFPWARLGMHDLEAVAPRAGFALLDIWQHADRCFAWLRAGGR